MSSAERSLPRLLTPEQLSASGVLPLAVQSLAHRRVSGDSPPFVKIGRRVFYDLDDVLAWIAERKRTSTAEGA